MKANALFGRAYALVIGAPGAAAAASFGNQGGRQSPLRIKFDIDKNVKGSPNKAKIEVYNMAPETRGRIDKGYLVELTVGYLGLVETLFIGSVAKAKTARQGSDIVTTMECGDGESAIMGATYDGSFPPNTTLATALQAIATAMSLTSDANPTGMAAGIAVAIPNVTYPKLSLHGLCRDHLDQLLKGQGMEWNLQNGALNIMPKTFDTGESAIVVSENTGMLGVPSRSTNVLSFTSLLNPRITPGRLVQLQSVTNDQINGFYKVKSGKYEGDTHDSHWQVVAECVLQTNVRPRQQAGAGDAATGFNYATAVV